MKKSEINSMKNVLKNIKDLKVTVSDQNVFLSTSQIPKAMKVHNVEGTLMFVDIRNSTVLTDVIGRKNMVKVYSMFSKICESAVDEVNGKILQIVGDGILCAFNNDNNMLSGHKAIHAALTIHTFIESAMNIQLDKDMKIGCGIGVRTGHIYVTRLSIALQDQVAYPSDITNYASKLCSEALAGNIIFDNKTLEHLPKNLKDISKIYQSDWGKFNIIEGKIWKIE